MASEHSRAVLAVLQVHFLKLTLCLRSFPSWWFQPSHLKNVSQIGLSPQVGLKRKNV